MMGALMLDNFILRLMRMRRGLSRIIARSAAILSSVVLSTSAHPSIRVLRSVRSGSEPRVEVRTAARSSPSSSGMMRKFL